MDSKVVIVESPGKIPTIKKYLGKAFQVVSSNGHVRDLPKKSFGIDIVDGFTPTYVMTPRQQTHVTALKKATDQATIIYLATDDDREGEAIAWHIKEALELPDQKCQRIVFRAITKAAIQNALAHPRSLDQHLIAAQQARRILDRIVGYELSPLLWRRVKNGLSAGRVQSVAVRLVVEKERAIHQFQSKATYKVKGQFSLANGETLLADLSDSYPTYQTAKTFLETCKNAQFYIETLTQKKALRAPGPPLMTSTLQQAAAQVLGYSIDQTMVLAQKLYEQGKITYMRTDSLRLSPEALQEAKKVIITTYGQSYHQIRRYQTKSNTAQEAHEAIRPTLFQEEIVSTNRAMQRLYALIRQRALASQMQDATLHRTTAMISITDRSEKMVAKGEVITFKGFLTLYDIQENLDQQRLPTLKKGEVLTPVWIKARETFTKPPSRYTEATLVKKLEELGIGRPSTYRPIIATIQQRGYVEKASRAAQQRTYQVIVLSNHAVEEKKLTELTGAVKNKLLPTSTGIVVHDFLAQHFRNIVDYAFTAHTEDSLDQIARNSLAWQSMLATFHTPFAKQVVQATQQSQQTEQGPTGRLLGKDPATGKPVIARLSRRYGPLVQIGSLDSPEKPRFASLPKEKLLDQITLEEALKLFDLPRQVGQMEGYPITAHSGKFGPYLKYQDQYFSLGTALDPYTVQEKEAIEVIEQKRKQRTPIKTFLEDPSITILSGRFGPYIKTQTRNIKIPKEKNPASLTWDECQDLIAQAATKKPRSRGRYTRKKRKS